MCGDDPDECDKIMEEGQSEITEEMRSKGLPAV